MKKDKNSLKQKIVIAIACLVIVACTISMTTMAWFTDTMQGTTNLTFGKIKLSDDFTEYTFNTPEAPAVASRKINDGDWTIVLDETSNDAFIRLKVSYGAPLEYTLTGDSTYLPNKAYYDHTTHNKLVAGDDYVVGADIPADSVDECNYSLAYVVSEASNSTGDTSKNLTLAKIAAERFTTQYYAVTSVLGTTFLKGVKYYAFVGGEFRALIGSTTYDANTDYYYGQAYSEFGHEVDDDSDPETPAVFVADTVYVGYNYTTVADNGTYKIAAVADTAYSALVEATSTEGTINIAANSVIGTTTNAVSGKMYRTTIYNAYIDWLIENVLLPESPEAAIDLGEYTSITTVGETNTVTTDNKYGFIRTDDIAQGTAEYYLVSDVTGTMLAAKRTNEANVTDSNDNTKTVEAGKSYNYVFAEDGDIKIADSADQITIKSATLTQIGTAKAAVTTYLSDNTHNDATKVLAYDGTHYTVYDSNVDYAAEGITFYYYSGDVTVINGHAYFFEVAANATPLVLKYAQKDLGLGMSVDIQAIQTILSRKAVAADANLYGASSVAVGDKLTIAIMTIADSHDVTGDITDESLAGQLGAYLNGAIQRVATIADLAPYFKAQFDRPAN